MKQITPLFLLVVLFFVSCTSEETIQPEETLLKTYKLNRDNQGKYTIDYKVKENTSSNFVKDLKTNNNEIYLYEGNIPQDTEKTEVLDKVSNRLNLDLYEGNTKSKSIIIEDDNIVLAKGEESQDYLESCSIESYGDESYELSFKIKDGTIAWFEYNAEKDIYEIHLKDGESDQLSFSKSYVKTSEILEINFVNHIKSGEAKSSITSYETTKAPKWIIL